MPPLTEKLICNYVLDTATLGTRNHNKNVEDLQKDYLFLEFSFLTGGRGCKIQLPTYNDAIYVLIKQQK
jgi:hypothetical protein